MFDNKVDYFVNESSPCACREMNFFEEIRPAHLDVVLNYVEDYFQEWVDSLRWIQVLRQKIAVEADVVSANFE